MLYPGSEYTDVFLAAAVKIGVQAMVSRGVALCTDIGIGIEAAGSLRREYRNYYYGYDRDPTFLYISVRHFALGAIVYAN